ncbi:winged helix-turn-helix domain-containing protein [Halomonas sp. I1]|uniref:winged helix-turn-helix domain-containing protein n=1 Tax=Halomonas sp. I1 TaxID=393536 RepID=UPI0028DDE6D6|nr:winged helix-turn-helix domain-containing protein [Halomonas sp. I1]MDT8894331.1 winged helix-turn-helix domain-containing protein [Halomonas sp. I1]
MAGPTGFIPGPSDALVGREVALERLMTLLDATGPTMMWVHGVAGIGKSALLSHFAHVASRGGACCLCLDGREIEPTPEGFLAALGEAAQLELDAPDDLAYLSGGQEGTTLIISVDAIESLRLLETWLRTTLMPRLPEGVRLLFSGRHRPATGWFGGPSGCELRSMQLGPLTMSEAVRWLECLGFSEPQARGLNRRLHGHPLAIQLAAATLPARPDFQLPDASLQHIMDALSDLYLADHPDPFQRQLLEGASVVRRVTEPLLKAMFPEASPTDAYARLRTLDFIEALPDGLGLHEMVREALGRSLLARDPQRHADYRRRAWQALVAQTSGSGRRELWRCTADLLYLVENPVVREAFFPTDRPELVVEPAQPSDSDSVRDIVDRHESPEGARALWRWWQTMPEAFWVVRDACGECQGVCCRFDPRQASSECLAEDPVTAAWCGALEERPVPEGQRVLFIRRWLGRDDGERPGEVQAACWLALKGDYMAMRPALRRVYLVLADLSPYAAVAETLGFQPLSHHRVLLDGCEHTTAVLDFGPRSVDGWLARLAAAELGLPGEDVWLDRQAHELIRQERRISLTPLEFGVLAYLSDRPGEAVGREQLLKEVWGSHYTGWSNKVDAVVVGLRRKLGEDADRIETVAGVGYRYRRRADNASSQGAIQGAAD